jgi:Trk-type K+ transport system membrane component
VVVFEAGSGITTTGSTVITELDVARPRILLQGRRVTWLAGSGIIAAAAAILPVPSVRNIRLPSSHGAYSYEKSLKGDAQTASALGGLYLLLTLACPLFYCSLGIDMFDASVHTMSGRDQWIGRLGCLDRLLRKPGDRMVRDLLDGRKGRSGRPLSLVPAWRRRTPVG